MGPAAVRGRLHRTGAPGDHAGWEGGRGQGSVSGHCPHHHIGREERRTPGRVAAAAFKGLDTRSLIDELGERLREEVDYLQEAENQELFARYYEDHPVIHVPHVVTELSTARVLTSELVAGAPFDEVLTWNQRERDMAAETINRFVSRSLYRLHAVNGDPHPGNYLFHGRGRVTFLDFGLTKHFTDEDLAPLADAVRFLVIENDGP